VDYVCWGIDPGTRNLAVANTDATHRLFVREKNEREFDFMKRVVSFLKEEIDTQADTCIVIERQMGARVSSVKRVEHILQWEMGLLGIPVLSVSRATVKRWVGVKGNCDDLEFGRVIQHRVDSGKYPKRVMEATNPHVTDACIMALMGADWLKWYSNGKKKVKLLGSIDSIKKMQLVW